MPRLTGSTWGVGRATAQGSIPHSRAIASAIDRAARTPWYWGVGGRPSHPPLAKILGIPRAKRPQDRLAVAIAPTMPWKYRCEGFCGPLRGVILEVKAVVACGVSRFTQRHVEPFPPNRTTEHSHMPSGNSRQRYLKRLAARLRRRRELTCRCGVEVITTRDSQRYCSPRCRLRHFRGLPGAPGAITGNGTGA
jgi:hypothetical protein